LTLSPAALENSSEAIILALGSFLHFLHSFISPQNVIAKTEKTGFN